ncbi:hypothetical protein [Paenibacillus sp. UNC451MF]|uniref:hypothetical protein n=1 Tax=Paenibacillus sp. UNC451MF TaxID=1449063 RepID=UPI000AD0A6B1|nr:hypothetical protein [Paenibacillus sp. UNC451MF]
MTNRKAIRLVLAAVIMFGGTVALYEWDQAVSAQQVQTINNNQQWTNSGNLKDL